MQDRIPKYPGRVKLIPVAGKENVYDMVRADEPQQEGTALNKANLMTDATAALFGLSSSAVPNDALAAIKTMLNNSNAEVSIRSKFATGTYTGAGGAGSDAPNTLTFGFIPKVVFVMSEGVICFFINGCEFGYGLHTNLVGFSLSSIFQTATWSGKTLSWYCSGYHPADGSSYQISSDAQLNLAGKEYHYVVFG